MANRAREVFVDAAFIAFPCVGLVLGSPLLLLTSKTWLSMAPFILAIIAAPGYVKAVLVRHQTASLDGAVRLWLLASVVLAMVASAVGVYWSLLVLPLMVVPAISLVFALTLLIALIRKSQPSQQAA